MAAHSRLPLRKKTGPRDCLSSLLLLLFLLVAGQTEAKENKQMQKRARSREKKQHLWVAIKATSRLRILHSRASTVLR